MSELAGEGWQTAGWARYELGHADSGASSQERAWVRIDDGVD